MSHASVARALPFLLPWTVLNDLFPSVEHFQVALQLIMGPLSLDPPYRTLFYTVLKHAQPVFSSRLDLIPTSKALQREVTQTNVCDDSFENWSIEA